MALEAGHPLQGVHHAGDILRRLLRIRQAHPGGALHRRQSQANIGGGTAVGRAHRGLLLKIVRGQEIVLLPGKVQKIPEVFPGGLDKIVPVRAPKALLLVGGERKGGGRRRAQKPHEAGGLADDGRGKGHEQQAQGQREPHLPYMLGKVMAAPLALSRRLPLEQPLSAYEHAPQSRDYGGKADPGLIGQKPEPDEGLDNGAAYAGEQPGMALETDLLPPGEADLGKGEQKIAQQGQQRRPGGQGQPAARQHEAGEYGQKGHGGKETAAQGIEKPEAVHGPQLPFEYPGGVLPVSSYPAVETLIIGQGLGGEIVGKLHVAHIGPVEIGPFQGVVGQDAPGGKAAAGTLQQSGGVYDALAGKAAVVKGVHIQLPAQYPVRVAAPGPGKDQGEVRGVGTFKAGGHPGVDEAVAPGHHMALGVYDRPVQRMDGGPDELAHGAGIHLGVAVQGDYISGAGEGLPVPGHFQGGGPAAQKPGQLQQRAPLPLPAAVLFPVKAALPGEEIKTAPVFPVQLAYLPPGPAQQLLVVLETGAFGGGQVCQQAELEPLSLTAAGQAQLLQPLDLPRPQNGGHHAEALALRRQAPAGVYPGQGPGRYQVQKQKVHEALYQLPHREQEQQGGGKTVQPEAYQQAYGQGQKEVQSDIQPGPQGRGLFKKVEAYMPPLLPGPLYETAGQHLLLQPGAPCQLFQTQHVFPAGGGVHALIVPAGVGGEYAPAHVRPGQQLFQIQHREQAQGSEKSGERLGVGGGVRCILHFPAHLGYGVNDGAAQSRGEQLQLPALQHRHRLKAGEEYTAALLRHLAQTRAHQLPAQLHYHYPLGTAAQPAGLLQLLNGTGIFPLDHVPVIQQPLAGGGRRRQRAVAALNRLVTAAYLPKAAAQQSGGLGPGTVVLGQQQLCGGGGVIVQPLFLNIKTGIYVIHGCLLSGKIFLFLTLAVSPENA